MSCLTFDMEDEMDGIVLNKHLMEMNVGFWHIANSLREKGYDDATILAYAKSKILKALEVSKE